MDRPFWFYGPVLRDTDLLNASRYPMVGLGKLAEAVLGQNIVVAGFSVAPTVPASLSVALGPGQVYQIANLEASQWAALGPDSHPIIKQGIALDSQNQTFAAPTTVGYSQNFLIQVAYADQDGGSTVLPYYNAAAPTQPFSGPGNSGTAQNTVRAGVANVTIKAGIAASSGTQTTPTPDAGYAGLYVVTLSQGQTTITAGNITLFSSSAFLPATLPAIPQGVQNGQWVFASATGTNTYAATFFSTAAYPFTFTTGMELLVFFANANTGASATLNGKAIVKAGGGAVSAGDIVGFIPLVYDGANLRINGLVASDIVSNITNNYAKGSLIAVRLFTASGNYAPTTGTNKVRVTVTGGGGYGGLTAATGSGQFAVAGGGGGGGTAISNLTSGFSGVFMTIGAGGVRSSTTIGGTTSFGSLLSATGGGGGSDGGANANGSGLVQAGGVGGTGTGGTERNISGGAGGLSVGFSSGNEASGFGGFSLWGAGASAVYTSTQTGIAAVNYGGGGSGAVAQSSAASQAGGSGLQGVILIEEYA